MMKKLLSLLIIFIALSTTAQDLEVKFGKVTKEELEMKQCSFYPEAESMILAESGDLHFIFNENKGWQYSITIIKRIKIFNFQDKDLANIKLSVYEPVSGSNREEVSGIKATTYNLVNGEIEKNKLSNSEKHSTRISDYRTEVSFALPNVKEGSVIEFQYNITSDFISTLYTWKFQNSIPTARSEFRYTLPEFLNYSGSQVGNFYSLERNETNRNETFSGVNSLSKQVILVGKDLLPVLDEPYQNNKPNLPCRIEFQLISTNYPGQIMKMVAGDYDKFNTNILEWESLGRTMTKGNFAKDKIATLSGTPTENAAAIYTWLQSHFTYNDNYGITSTKAGKSAFNEGIGSVADINLSLVAALREAKIEAYPVILSTRGHGIPHPVYPNYEDFNYVIAGVLIDGKIYLADASTSLPFGMLPTRCLNDKGWLVADPKGQWVDLKSNAKHAYTLMSEITISDESMSTKHDIKYSQYAAYEEMDKIKEDEKEYQEAIASGFTEHDFSNFNHTISDTDLKLSFEVTKELDNPDIIYIQPVSYLGVKENPFKREKRFSPVDFPVAQSKKIMVKINIPEGYQAELPEKTIIQTPGNAAKFTYTANQIGNQITVMSLFDLNKTTYIPDEYDSLKQFYELVSKKNSEMIILKKI